MGEPLETWEMILLGLVGVGGIFLLYPGLKRISAESEKAEKDWSGLLLPIGAVVAFVILLIMIV